MVGLRERLETKVVLRFDNLFGLFGLVGGCEGHEGLVLKFGIFAG